MSLSNKGIQISDTKQSTSSKATTLNPNAAEFIPFSLRSTSSSGSTSAADATTRFVPSVTVEKPVLDRSVSSVSNNSDDEARQYWRRQLPDDITPDFSVMNEDDSHRIGNISLAGLSLHDGSEASDFAASTGGSGYRFGGQEKLSPNYINRNSIAEKIGYSASSYGEDLDSASLSNFPANPWDKQLVNGDEFLGHGRESHPYNGASGQGFMNNIFGEHGMTNDADINPVEFLASQFPGFAAESLAEVYFANGCDLNLTIEMLAQLELQVDSGFSQNLNSKTSSAPNLTKLDFPALMVSDGQNSPLKFARDDLPQSGSIYRSPEKENMLMFKSSSSQPSGGAIDFASAVRKLASQDSGLWKYDRNGSPAATVGSTRSSHVPATTYGTSQGKGTYNDNLQSCGSARAGPVWLETGDAVGNMYSEMRKEAHDHARLRNAYFEQAREAYLIGNKGLAKELSLKGQLHNMNMKAAHGKAQESIYRQRNPVRPENTRGQERMIDLHGLHATEAIHVLKHELTALRSTVRAAGQHMQVYICVGTGHHTRGSRTPARLPIAVQRYLLEEEALSYSEPQPGLLRVVIY